MSEAKGLLPVILVAALSGGGGSVAANKIWGPGGEWQELVSNQIRLQEQQKTTNDTVDKLSLALTKGIDKLVLTLDKDSETDAAQDRRIRDLEYAQKLLVNNYNIAISRLNKLESK